MTKLIIDGVEDKPDATLILAHGSGQPATAPFMQSVTELLLAVKPGLRVVRFNFPYMARAIEMGKHRPPDRAPVLEQCWSDVIARVRDTMSSNEQLFIGGKSLGGRLATMVAQAERVDGVVCLGYPFHPPGKPEKLRTEHLADIDAPVLMCQGERDPFGTREEVPGYHLPDNFSLHWVTDGEHSFKPRKRSGVTLEQNLADAAEAIAAFMH